MKCFGVAGMRVKCFGVAGRAREWGGLGGPPPFEGATSTPGAGVGGFGGSPPFEEATNHREGTGYAVACPLHVYLIEKLGK